MSKAKCSHSQGHCVAPASLPPAAGLLPPLPPESAAPICGVASTAGEGDGDVPPAAAGAVAPPAPLAPALDGDGEGDAVPEELAPRLLPPPSGLEPGLPPAAPGDSSPTPSPPEPSSRVRGSLFSPESRGVRGARSSRASLVSSPAPSGCALLGLYSVSLLPPDALSFSEPPCDASRRARPRRCCPAVCKAW